MIEDQNNQLDEALQQDILLEVEKELSKLKQKKPRLDKLKKMIPKKINKADFTKKLNRRTAINVSIVTITCIATVIMANYFFPIQRTVTVNGKRQPVFTTTKLTTGNPQYKTILPAGKTIVSLGGWKRSSPESADPVYAYSDKINNVTIAVSQQPLPENFKDDTSTQIEKMAMNFNATDKITIGSNHIYVGTSGDGPQSVIFTKKNLLVLIKSVSKISDDEWVKYYNSLQ